MARANYGNGDEISLSSGCDGCQPIMVQGVFCHETGCPEAWRGKQRACFVCGFDFHPETRHESLCGECITDIDDEIEEEDEDDE